MLFVACCLIHVEGFLFPDDEFLGSVVLFRNQAAEIHSVLPTAGIHFGCFLSGGYVLFEQLPAVYVVNLHYYRLVGGICNLEFTIVGVGIHYDL